MGDFDRTKDINLEAIIGPHDEDGRLAENCRTLAVYLDGKYSTLAEDYWSFWVNSAEFGAGFDAGKIRKSRDLLATYLEMRTGHFEERQWLNISRSMIVDSCERGVPLAMVMAATATANTRFIDSLMSDPSISAEEQARHVDTMSKLNAIELTITATIFGQHEQMRFAERQLANSANFEADIGNATSAVAEQTSLLKHQAASSSQMAHGMLAKTSEVAAASEQSAVAMREAAQTAAGLIRAIEDARTEVETASDVADARCGSGIAKRCCNRRPVRTVAVDRFDPWPDPRYCGAD